MTPDPAELDPELLSRYCDRELSPEQDELVENALRTSTRLRATVGQIRDLKRIVRAASFPQEQAAIPTQQACSWENKILAMLGGGINEDIETHLLSCPQCLRTALQCSSAQEGLQHGAPEIPESVLQRPAIRKLIRAWLLPPEYTLDIPLSQLPAGKTVQDEIKSPAGTIRVQTEPVALDKLRITMSLLSTDTPSREYAMKLQRPDDSGKLLSFTLSGDAAAPLPPLARGEYQIICAEPAFTVLCHIH